jgi:hypothetical protein
MSCDARERLVRIARMHGRELVASPATSLVVRRGTRRRVWSARTAVKLSLPRNRLPGVPAIGEYGGSGECFGRFDQKKSYFHSRTDAYDGLLERLLLDCEHASLR